MSDLKLFRRTEVTTLTTETFITAESLEMAQHQFENDGRSRKERHMTSTIRKEEDWKEWSEHNLGLARSKVLAKSQALCKDFASRQDATPAGTSPGQTPPSERSGV